MKRIRKIFFFFYFLLKLKNERENLELLKRIIAKKLQTYNA